MSQKGRISLSQSIALQAPLSYGDQVDLEQLIEKSKREESERTKFTASASASAAHAAKAKTGQLKTTSYLSQLQQDFSVARAKALKNQGRKNGKTENVGPTPERLRKTVNDDGVQAIHEGKAVKSHTVQSPVDQYAQQLPEEFENAARQLLKDFLLADAGARVTASYDGVGGSVPGPRHGGVQDRVRAARATVDLIQSTWPPILAQMVDWFVTQTVTHGDGRAMKFQDAGEIVVPKVRGWTATDTHKGAGWGLFYAMLATAVRFYGRQQALSGKTGTAPSAEATRALMSELHARAQIRRERLAKAEERKQRGD